MEKLSDVNIAQKISIKSIEKMSENAFDENKDAIRKKMKKKLEQKMPSPIKFDLKRKTTNIRDRFVLGKNVWIIGVSLGISATIVTIIYTVEAITLQRRLAFVYLEGGSP